MGEMGSMYRIFIIKPQEKIPHGRTILKWIPEKLFENVD
jgi:hypothetical protein